MARWQVAMLLGNAVTHKLSGCLSLSFALDTDSPFFIKNCSPLPHFHGQGLTYILHHVLHIAIIPALSALFIGSHPKSWPMFEGIPFLVLQRVWYGGSSVAINGNKSGTCHCKVHSPAYVNRETHQNEGQLILLGCRVTYCPQAGKHWTLNPQRCWKTTAAHGISVIVRFASNPASS